MAAGEPINADAAVMRAALDRVMQLCDSRDQSNPFGPDHPHHPTWVLVSSVRIAATSDVATRLAGRDA